LERRQVFDLPPIWVRVAKHQLITHRRPRGATTCKAHTDGYQYSQFCWLYQQWAGRVDVVMRRHHRAGDKLFVDYAGQTIPIYPPDAPVWQAELSVAVFGASNYTFAEATASQQSEC
jgi:transposase